MFASHRRSPAALVLVLFIGLLGAAPPTAVEAAHTAPPSSVTLVGSLQSSLGCDNDWDPTCAATQLSYDAADDVWQASFSVPSGSWQYKVALNGSWGENYGANAQFDGSNIALNLAAATTVKFYYSHTTHWITSSENATVATAAGSFQSELDCPDDWQPDCLRSWLQDPDGNGTYTFSTSAIPAGNYAAKAALDEGWATSYPADNVPFSVGAGQTVTFTFVATANFSIDVSGGSAGHDDDIWWADLGHDSRDPLYRTPTGAVQTGTPVQLRLRAASGDLTAARVRLWNDRIDSQSILDMTRVADDGTYEWWQATVPASSVPTIFWYRFIAIDGSATAYYEDDAARTGGWGETFGSSPDFSWQLTVYDPAFQTPDWVKNAVIYQIFPDRFRDGDSTNNPAAGQFFYGETPTIIRSGGSDWNTPVCDPRDSSGACPGAWSQNFYGGDLQGVLDKLDYLQDVGVTALYLNPVFESPSNHKYDTTDFSQIDPAFGDLAKLQELAAALDGRGMRMILDGVFNHTSSDSIYFDRYSRFAEVGACESHTSDYRDWYHFTPATPGTGACVGDDGTPAAANYESWFGYASLPKLDSGNSEVRDFFYAGAVNPIGPYWLTWADGWRLDVGGDVDPGLTNDPSNDFWEGFRTAVRAAHSDAYIVGEEWGMATPWTLGHEWDATMNYQLSSALLSLYRDEAFTDNDHNTSSSAGVLAPITPDQFRERVLNLQERYPPQAFAAMMNLLGSHDTNRPLFMLDHNADQNDRSLYENASYDWSDAITRLMGVVVLQGTLPGAPTIYYGDEVGLVAPPTHDGATWQDDPYNRVPYPWLDEGGTPFYSHLQSEAGQAQLLDHYSAVFGARNDHAALRTGDLRFLSADGADALVFGRKMADHSDAAVVIVNRGASAANVAVDVAGYLPAGTQLTNALNTSETITVGLDGSLSVSAGARSFGIFVTSAAFAAPPAAPTGLAVTDVGASYVDLSWSAASGAGSYIVYRSLLSGGGYEEVGTTSSTTFSDTGLDLGTTYHYVVISHDDTTLLTSGHSNEASATTGHDLGSAWHNVQWPPSVTHTISTTNRTDLVFGRIWIDGVTSEPGAPAGVRAQLGWGPDGSTPDDSWAWEEMAYNTQHGNDDEYMGSLLPDQVGEFDYTIRYSGDDGATWHLAIDGPEGDPEGIRPLTVNPSSDTTPPAAPQLEVDGTTASSISLSWTVPADTDLAGFELFRDGARIATLGAATTSHVDDSVTTGQAYEYVVKAYDTSFNRAASNVVQASAENRVVAVTFTVGVPSYTPDSATVYVTGSIAELGPWNPSANPMTDNGDGTWSRTFDIAEGTSFEWKYTRGSWETVEQWGSIAGLGNRGPVVVEYGTDGTMLVDNTATDWGTGADSEKAVRDWRDPLVVSHSPAADAVDVPVDSTIVVTWSKPMQPSTSFAVSGPGATPVDGTFALSDGDTVVTFTPASPLAEGTEYDVAASGQSSAGGDNQQVGVSFSFTTVEPGPDTTPPTTSDAFLALREGGQVRGARTPVLLSWSATDNVTAADDLLHGVQARRRAPGGAWSPWRSVGTWSGVEEIARMVNGRNVAFQFRVRSRDAAGNWGAWAVFNTLVPNVHQSQQFTFSGSWTQVNMRGALGGSVSRSSMAGSTATLAFTGDGVAVVMPANANQGSVEVCVDAGTAAEQCLTVDLSTFQPTGPRRLVAVFDGLAHGPHGLRVTVVGGMVNLDAGVFTTP